MMNSRPVQAMRDHVLPPFVPNFSRNNHGLRNFQTGGKQYRVQEGDTISVDKLPVEADDEIKFPEVLLVNDGENTTVGAPTVEGAGVTAKVIEQHRGKKGVAFKFKRRKGFHKTIGFRHHLTKLEITSING